MFSVRIEKFYPLIKIHGTIHPRTGDFFPSVAVLVNLVLTAEG
jgi:hypothetical protein